LLKIDIRKIVRIKEM